VDLKLFAELTKIENALVGKQSVVEALAWCGENRGTLKKTKVSLPLVISPGFS
jgi:macrophage erythroblast attacher